MRAWWSLAFDRNELTLIQICGLLTRVVLNLGSIFVLGQSLLAGPSNHDVRLTCSERGLVRLRADSAWLETLALILGFATTWGLLVVDRRGTCILSK